MTTPIDYGVTYTDVKDLAWGDEAQTLITTQTKFESHDDYLPFGAMATDVTAHGQQIFKECMEGKWGEIAPFDETILPPAILYQRYLAKGLSVKFEGNPDVSSVYPVSDDVVNALVQEAQYVNLFGTFTADDKYTVKDTEGVVNTFTDIAVFLSFVKAVMQYVAALRKAYNYGSAYPTSNKVTL